MSMSNLSIDGEFRYIIQWFNEWSELQRDDFVYVFVEYLKRDTSVGVTAGSTGGVYLNGVVNSMAATGVQDKPMSLFQCRIKLFREWSRKWPVEFKCKLQEKINEIDAKVGEKIINELKGSHAEHNGDIAVHLNANGSIENGEVEHATADAYPSVVTASTAARVETDNDNHLAAVLRQETPVDDDDDGDDHNAADDVVEMSANERNTDTNGHSATAAVTTIAVNTLPQSPNNEPVEQVESNVTASVIVSVAAAS